MQVIVATVRVPSPQGLTVDDLLDAYNAWLDLLHARGWRTDESHCEFILGE